MKKTLSAFFFFSSLIAFAQETKIPYGYNDEAGKYFDAGGVKLYYEIYGKGTPVLMLHGGVYGYIDEYEFLIPKLAQSHQVICLATRGHVKSEIGNEPNTYKQRATDAYKLVQHLELDSVTVIGFSDGGHAALKMAALYPQSVRRLVVMGAGFHQPGARTETFNYTPEELMKGSKEYFTKRLKHMPEPERWGEALAMVSKMYNEDSPTKEDLESIECPVLMMSGDKDGYSDVASVVSAYELIKQASLSIIPACGHVIFYCNFPAVWESMKGFVK